MFSKKQQWGTLLSFLPLPANRYQARVSRHFLMLLTYLPASEHSFIREQHLCGTSQKIFDAVVQFHQQLGVIAVKRTKRGIRYAFNLDRTRELVREAIVAGISANDRHIVLCLHTPAYECFTLPLTKLFPEFLDKEKRRQARREYKKMAAAYEADQ